MEWVLLFLGIIILVLLAIVLSFCCHKKSFQEGWEEQISSKFSHLIGRPLDPIFQHIYNHHLASNAGQDIEQYAHTVHAGKRLLQNSVLMIAGLIRNCETRVGEIASWYNQLKTWCPNTSFLILENDSRDQTRSRLLEWSHTDPSVKILCPYPRPLPWNDPQCQNDAPVLDNSPSSFRIERMAHLRNTYLRELKQMKGDFVLVIDLDLRGDFFMDGLFHSVAHMQQRPSIDAIACNGLLKSPCPVNPQQYTYYDAFAYVPLGEASGWNTLFDKRSHDDDVIRYVTSRYISGEHLGLDRVRSAFGGACLYRKSSLDRAEYGFSRDQYRCEHTVLHEQFKEVYVNPRMLFLIQDNLD